jgi:hypothetical protein
MAVENSHLKLQLIEKNHLCSALEDKLKIQNVILEEKERTIENQKTKIDDLLHHHYHRNGSDNGNVYRPPKLRNSGSEEGQTKYNPKERKGFPHSGSFHHYNKHGANGEKTGSFQSSRSGSYNNKFNFNNKGNKPPGLEHNGWRKQTGKGSTSSAHAHKKEEPDRSIPTSNIFASLNDDEHDSDSITTENEIENEIENEENMVEEPETMKEEEKEDEPNSPAPSKDVSTPLDEAIPSEEEAVAEAVEIDAVNSGTPSIIPEPEPMPEIETTASSAAELLG